MKTKKFKEAQKAFTPTNRVGGKVPHGCDLPRMAHILARRPRAPVLRAKQPTKPAASPHPDSFFQQSKSRGAGLDANS